MNERIYLSPPHIGQLEQQLVAEAFESNWIAPLGPHVDAFEREFCDVVQSRYACALSSGTAALHLALIVAGVRPGDEVLVSTLTFAATINAIMYVGAFPIMVDSERRSWNLDPALLSDVLAQRARSGKVPRALVLVHLYGQAADIDQIAQLCDRFGVILIEDAAEALGATYRGRAPGTFGALGVYSFNGNKIITTSGGGMLVSSDASLIHHARKLATQAREPAPHYEHREIGFNYRMSNVLAAIGRGQLRVLDERVRARRANYEAYSRALGGLPGFSFMPDAGWGRHSRWLTVATVDDRLFGASREQLRLSLEAENIEARPVWKPMHLQPAYRKWPVLGGAVAEDLFRRGICLPSGSSLCDTDRQRVIDTILDVHERSVEAEPL